VDVFKSLPNTCAEVVGIDGLRFGLFQVATVSSGFCCRGKDRCKFGSFPQESLNSLGGHQPGVDDQVQPKEAFVTFFEDNADLGSEFRARAGAARYVIVGTDRSRATYQLAANGPAAGLLWEPIYKAHDADGEVTGALLEVVRRHGMGELLIANVKLQISQYGAEGARFPN
jgi:hypothetical protein